MCDRRSSAHSILHKLKIIEPSGWGATHGCVLHGYDTGTTKLSAYISSKTNKETAKFYFHSPFLGSYQQKRKRTYTYAHTLTHTLTHTLYSIHSYKMTVKAEILLKVLGEANGTEIPDILQMAVESSLYFFVCFPKKKAC